MESAFGSLLARLTFLLAALPPAAYGYGRLKAAAILDGTDYYYLTAPAMDSLPMGDVHDAKNRIKYLGHVNDYVFLLLPDSDTTVIIRFDKTRGLQLKRFQSSTEPPKPARQIARILESRFSALLSP
jgi:hypothetical protein